MGKKGKPPVPASNEKTICQAGRIRKKWSKAKKRIENAEIFANERAKALEELRFVLNRQIVPQTFLQYSPLDKNVRKVIIKLSQLPFAFTTFSCQGHTSIPKYGPFAQDINASKIKRLGHVNPNERFNFGGSIFEMVLDHSQEARHFEKALIGLKERLNNSEIGRKYLEIMAKRYSGIPVKGLVALDRMRYKKGQDFKSSFTGLSMHVESRSPQIENPYTRKEIQTILEANQLFIKEFEKVVDRFVKEYGIGRKRTGIKILPTLSTRLPS